MPETHNGAEAVAVEAPHPGLDAVELTMRPHSRALVKEQYPEWRSEGGRIERIGNVISNPEIGRIVQNGIATDRQLRIRWRH